MDSNDPRTVVYQLFGAMFSGNMNMREFKSLIYIDSLDEDDLDQKKFDEMMATFRSQMESTGLPLPVIADLTISNMKFTVDGDDTLGYKIIVEAAGTAAQDLFAVKQGGRFKIAAFSAAQDSLPEQLAFLALNELQKNNLVAARKWLDRARDKIHMGGGDDPLAGNPFPHFWTKGQEADASVARLAARVLMPSKQLKTTNLAAVIAARDAAKTDIDLAELNLVLASAYAAQQRWSDQYTVAIDLLKGFPNSLRAFDLATMSLAGLKRFDEWDKLVEARRAAHPDELAYIRSAARLAAYRGQFDKAREIIKTIMDKGQSSSEDLNLYAWFALALPTAIDQEAIDTAVRATDLAKESFAIQHTLGCVYAQAGKTSQARELLLRAMDDNHLEEPNSEIWFGFALIAEQYGATDAAQKMFARVEKPKTPYPGDSYYLAQQHLASLKSSAKLTASAK
jgi:tetratricopeptide (TPR) repeat protein